MKKPQKKLASFIAFAFVLAACATPSSSTPSTATSLAPEFDQSRSIVLYTRGNHKALESSRLQRLINELTDLSKIGTRYISN